MTSFPYGNPYHTSRRYLERKDHHPMSRKGSIAQQRMSLPIAAAGELIVEEVRKNDILIIVGETGSGKTTQLPQFLFNAGFCQDGRVIGITQPRRVAAVSVAKRVAEECNVELGGKVGYAVRFDDKTSRSTKIKYMTEGLLLREALSDPFFGRYSVMIIDEAHERTVHTDVLLGLLKSVQKSRSICREFKYDGPKMKLRQSFTIKDNQGKSIWKSRDGVKLSPLKLIIMSASLNAKAFSEYFDGAKVVHIQGRQYCVDRMYTYQLEPDHQYATMFTIFKIHFKEDRGDILVFLTGQEEIESFERLLKEQVCQLPEQDKKLLIFPFYSGLPSEQQMEVFKPTPLGFRKVILATNIAETSVTIPGIKYVIDPGFVKVRSYDPKTGVESLVTVHTSKAQAVQRSGRAGREEPGKCYCLYPETDSTKRMDSTVPEIKRCNLSNVILQLKALGVDDIIGFDFMEKPPRLSIMKSLEQLCLLGALTDEHKLSDPIGIQMAKLPLDPVYSKALLLAVEFSCLEEMLIVVTMLSVDNIFYFPREKQEEANTAKKHFSSADGDHITLLNIFRSSLEFLKKCKTTTNREKTFGKGLPKWCRENFINYRFLRNAHNIHSQIKAHVQKMGLPIASCGTDMLQFQRCLAAAFFFNTALKQRNGSYRTITGGQIAWIHPYSVLFKKRPECIIFNELVKTNDINYIRKITRIDRLWLPELVPQFHGGKTQLAEEWISEMSPSTVDDEYNELEPVGLSSRFSLRAKDRKHMEVGVSALSLERKLRKFVFGKCKSKSLEEESEKPKKDNHSDDEEDDEPQSRAAAFSKKRMRLTSITSQSKKIKK